MDIPQASCNFRMPLCVFSNLSHRRRCVGMKAGDTEAMGEGEVSVTQVEGGGVGGHRLAAPLQLFFRSVPQLCSESRNSRRQIRWQLRRSRRFMTSDTHCVSSTCHLPPVRMGWCADLACLEEERPIIPLGTAPPQTDQSHTVINSNNEALHTAC